MNSVAEVIQRLELGCHQYAALLPFSCGSQEDCGNLELVIGGILGAD